nr:hypothetical protein [Tanacetum cinerariifolium]
MEGLNIALKDAVASGLIHEIEDTARVTGCASLPFIYLGLPIGSNMNLIAYWQFMIDRFRRRMSTWKEIMLSIGGRFTLIKAVLGSLEMEMAVSHFSDSLWARVVKVIHGDDTGMELKGCKVSDTWTWNWKRHLGSRNEESLEILKTEIGRVQVNDCPDSWHWNGGDDGVFSVSATRMHADNCILSSLSPSTRWSKILPPKVNIFIWRLILDRLSHRLNLSLRGLDIQSITCPSCNTGLESHDHIFFGCDTASNIWRLIRVWIDVSMPSFVSCSVLFQWLED